jgi:5,10-methylenetetrahydromethanopterin reductase
MMAMLGAPAVTFERLADLIYILRRLWAGEDLRYEGILGRFPQLRLPDRYSGPPPPILFTAIGPKSLAFTGAHCDGVLLHPFISLAGVAESAAIVRTAAEQAGRDPTSVRIYHSVVVATDMSGEATDAIVRGRAITYFELPSIGNMIVKLNGWDTGVLQKIRSHPKIAALEGMPADQAFGKEELVEVGKLIPQQWLDEGAAIGTAAQCATKLLKFLDAGADEIVLHGSSPQDMVQLLNEIKRTLAERSV